MLRRIVFRLGGGGDCRWLARSWTILTGGDDKTRSRARWMDLSSFFSFSSYGVFFIRSDVIIPSSPFLSFSISLSGNIILFQSFSSSASASFPFVIRS